MKKEVILKENLKKNPYRGILVEMANEQGVTPQGIISEKKSKKKKTIDNIRKILLSL